MSRGHTDRNMLFGILALQMDFVSRDQLVAAMHAWVLDKAKPLGEILRCQGAIRDDTHALLDALVNKHLALHGDDAERSLAALKPIISVREELRHVADADVQVSLGHVCPAQSKDDDPHATAAPTVGALTSAGLRFRILRPHAKGGLGEVFVARDEELHREVALKEIQGNRADDPESRLRFLLEAEVTGGLEHPGIVPVYGLGSYPDGRPYYAMRLIRGESLQDAIDRFHGAEARRGERSERAVALRELLGRFVDVCNAVTYAHSRGVLHRDLKPGNIMLGPYGETLVVDWGLAKTLGRADPAEGVTSRPLEPASASDVTPTQAGAAVGTPAYMAPEQAEGRLTELGPASDVYSLGATLYALLTGRAPFRGATDAGAVLRQVQRGEFPRPRTVEPGVPGALEAICLKALALRPAERYASPRALADDIERFLADEPVGAYREPLGARLARWGRRHRTAVTTAAALVVAAAGALAVGLVAVNAEKEQTTWALTQVTEEQGKTAAALQAETAALERSRAAEKSAGEQRQLALNTVRSVVYDIQARLKDRPGQKDLRKALLGRALAGLTDVARAADTATAIDHETTRVHLELGDIFLEIEEGGSVEALKQYELAHAVAQQVWQTAPERVEALRDLAVAHSRLGEVSLRLGHSKAALEHVRQVLEVNQLLAGADASDAQAQRDLAGSHEKLSVVYLELGDSKAARDHYQKALELRQHLAEAEATSAQAQRDLGLSYERLGDVSLRLGEKQAALGHYRKALELHQHLADADGTSAQAQRDVALCHMRLGDAFTQLHDNPAALEHYQQGLAICQHLAGADRSNAQAQRDLSLSHERVGDGALRLGDPGAAREHYRKALEVRRRLADADKASARAQRDLALAHVRLGEVYLQTGDPKAALEQHRTALEISQRLADADETSAQAQRDLAVAHDRLGDDFLLLLDIQAALGQYQKALELRRRLADADSASAQTQRELLVSFFKLGNAAEQNSDFKAALGWYDQGLQVPKGVANPEVLQQEVALLERRARLCRAAEAAVADPATAFRQPEDLGRPALIAAMYALIRREKQPARALAAADLLAENAVAASNLYDAACGYALCVPLADKPQAKEKHAARAVELLRQAVARGYKDAAHMKQDSDLKTLRERDDFKKLVADLEAASKPSAVDHG